MFPIFLALSAATAAFALLQFLMPPVLPILQGDLGLSADDAAWILLAWLLSAAVSTPAIARLGDIHGKPKVLAATLLTVALGCAISAIAPTLDALLLGRVIQGPGGAIIPLAFAIAKDLHCEQQTAKLIGRLNLMVPLVGVAALLTAVPLASALGWHSLFWLSGGCCVVAAVLVLRAMPSVTIAVTGRMNWLSALVLGGALLPMLLALTEANHWGWGSWRQLLALSIALLAGIVWYRVERRSSHPLIGLGRMRDPQALLPTLLAIVFGAISFALWTLLPWMAPGSSPLATGAMIALLIATAAAGPIAARSPKRQLIWAAALSLGAGVLLAWRPHSPAFLIAACGLIGYGQGIASSAIPMLMLKAYPAEQAGMAAGLAGNSRMMGGTLGSGLVATCLANASGLSAAAWICTGLALLAWILTIDLSRPAKQSCFAQR